MIVSDYYQLNGIGIFKLFFTLLLGEGDGVFNDQKKKKTLKHVVDFEITCQEKYDKRNLDGILTGCENATRYRVKM
jgi:hypothetical protein